jgi:putative nucleotidyltransferase with HDIG domain
MTFLPGAKTNSPASAPKPMSAELVALIKRGAALERRGPREEARALYTEALRGRDRLDATQSAQLLRLIARTHMQDSNYAAADEAAHAALRISEEAGDEASRGNALNMLAVIQNSQGDLDKAERLYLAARESAERSGEARLATMTATNLGVVATVRGDHAQALGYHMASLRDARSGGLADEALKALNNLGLLHTQMGRYAEADASYAEALSIGEVLGDLSVRIVLELNVAKLRLRQEDHEAARAACDRARALAHDLGDPRAEGETAHIRGLIARAIGDVAGAERWLLDAEATGILQHDLILQGETARELADLYRAQGRNRETLQRLNQSHRLFSQLRARRELADVDRRTAELESDFLEVVRKWGDSIESKDRYTQGHCVRVADLACELWATVNGDDATSLFWFRIGALLHDVGKLVVPAEVLNKEGKLTAEEWDLVRGHPSAGVELLADIDFPWDVRPIIESHHERWDGKGYPHQLAGEAIPLTARVLCIADIYDALTSVRSYKRAFTHDEAMEIMRADVGKQFDPTLFAAFEEIIRRDISGADVAPATLKIAS